MSIELKAEALFLYSARRLRAATRIASPGRLKDFIATNEEVVTRSSYPWRWGP